MASSNGTRFHHICLQCGQERWSRRQNNPSGLCPSCTLANGRQQKHALHYAPGAFYADEPLAVFWSKVNKNIACACHSWEDRCWPWTGTINKITGYGTIIVQGKPIGTHRFAYQSVHGLLPKGIAVLHRPPCLLRHCVRHVYAGTPKQNTTDAIVMQRFPTGTLHAELHHDYQTLPHGDNHWTRKQPEKIPRGDNHWTHREPEKLAFGEHHWTQRHPEKLLRGSQHAEARQHYVNLPRGSAHAALHQDYINIPRGEDHPHALFTTAEILAMRADYKAGMRPAAIAKKYTRNKSTVWGIVTGRAWKHIEDTLEHT